MHLRFLADEPIQNTLEDFLGWKDFSELVYRSIKNTGTPFVYGILGDWGTGKTSILNLLKNILENDLQSESAALIPIWFNAWQYENEENIIYPVLYAIKNDYERRITVPEKARGFGKTFLQVAATSALALTDVGLRAATKALTGEAVKLDEVKQYLDLFRNPPEQWETLYRNWADSVANLHSAFEQLLKTYAADYVFEHRKFKAEDVRFVILIDDLDRCLPDTTIALLESIKNFLTVKGCIFVFGLNANVVYQGIRHKYQGLPVDGREYLEKILNYTFYVPEPAIRKVSSFIDEWIKRLGKDLDAAQLEQLRPHFNVFGSVLEECRFNNPRRIKRIINRYLLFLDEHEGCLDQYYLPNIVRLITMAEYFPSIYRLLLGLSKPGSVFADIQKMIRGDYAPKEFEAKYEMQVGDTLGQVKIMQKLFDLVDQTDRNKPDLQQQVQEIFRLTRMV